MKQTLFYTFLLLFVTLSSASLAAVTGNDPLFTVENVEVDITSESAVKAREEAFKEAQTQAFLILSERLLSRDELLDFETPDLSYISPLVQDFEIKHEQLSNVRYKASYTFRFKEENVRRFFGGQGVVHAQEKRETILVLPFYQWGTRAVLWGQGNPWIISWKDSLNTGRLLPVSVPIGDLSDMMDIEDDQALTYDSRRLQRMKERYHAQDIVILIAALDNGKPRFNPDAIADTTMSIYIYRAGPDAPEYLQTLKMVPTGEESFSAFFARAVIDVKRFLGNGLDQYMTEQKEKTFVTVKTVTPLRSMREWIELQALLKQIEYIKEIEVISLRPQKVETNITFEGTALELQRLLSDYNLALTPHWSIYGSSGNEPEYYTLERKDSFRR